MNAGRANRILLAASILALGFGCRSVARTAGQGKAVAAIQRDSDRKDYLESIGSGAADPSVPNDAQRKSMARDAAILKAQYEMLSRVQGVELDGGVTVRQAIDADAVLEARLKDAIRGAEIVRSEFASSGACVVTIRLPKKRLEETVGVKVQ